MQRDGKETVKRAMERGVTISHLGSNDLCNKIIVQNVLSANWLYLYTAVKNKM